MHAQLYAKSSNAMLRGRVVNDSQLLTQVLPQYNCDITVFVLGDADQLWQTQTFAF